MPDPDFVSHDFAGLAIAPADAALYVRACGFIDGPLDDPAAAQRLAGGAIWFSAVQLIVRAATGERLASVVVPVRDRQTWQEGLPAALRTAFDRQWQHITATRPPLDVGGKMLGFTRPQVMGILNLTPDSFSDGGKFADPAAAVERAHALMRDGGAIIDIGAESTRPGAKPVWEGDEIARLEPVLAALKGSSGWLSADTRKAAVMRMALGHGTQIINDVSALTHEKESLAVVAAAGCPVILMHLQGDPQTMQGKPHYQDVLLDVFDHLEQRIAACEAAGVARSKIIIDPGIGFGKSLRHNLDLLNGLGLFHALGCPLLLGASRKTFIGALSREEPATERFPGSLAAALHGLNQGVQIVRVHDVAETVQAVKIWQGLRDAGVTPRG
jgi:dihydropteroate synthase